MNTSDLRLTQADTNGVPPHEIPRVLEMLWRDSVSEDAEGAVVQVRTINLLIVIPQPLAQAELFRVIDTIAVQHPGRIIAMIITPDAQAPRAQVAIACRFGDRGKQLCGELITITCGDQGRPLPSIAASLSEAGVPTFLWWVGDPPFASDIFESFVDSVDHVLVDSRTWRKPVARLVSLADTVALHPYIAFTDLQWTALTPWRRQTAQCFDVPDAQPYLERITDVRITHGSGDTGRVAALLFIGWLASRLGWHYVEAEGPATTFKAGERKVVVQLTTIASNAVLYSVIFQGADAAFSLRYQSDTRCVKTRITLPHTADIDRIAPLTALTLVQTVSEELNMLDRDLRFEAALRLAVQSITIKRPS